MKRCVLTVLLLATLVTVPVQSAMASSTCTTPQLTGFKAPDLIYAGDKATGTVSLSCAAASTITVSLTSDNAELTVPATVTVARGKSSVNVLVTAGADLGGQYVAHVTATYAEQSVAGAITVDPGLKSVELPLASEPNTVDPDVLLTGPAPAGGLTVQVASDNPAVTVPSTASFQEWSYGDGIPGVVVHPVTKDTTVHISVTLGTHSHRFDHPGPALRRQRQHADHRPVGG